MTQPRLMNDVKSDTCRQFAQQAFEESLMMLQQLSLEEDLDGDLPTIMEDLAISWDEVADDLENFFGHGIACDPFTETGASAEGLTDGDGMPEGQGFE